jgi:hypothetical protein
VFLRRIYDELQTYLDQPWIFTDINIKNIVPVFTAAVTAALAELPAVGAGARDPSSTPSRAPLQEREHRDDSSW